MPDAAISSYVRSVLALRLDVDATAIAEALWLAAAFPETAPTSVAGTAPDQPIVPQAAQPAPERPGTARLRLGPARRPATRREPSQTPASVTSQTPSTDSLDTVSPSAGSWGAVSRVRVKRTRNPESLNVIRSLRPFRQRWPTGRRLELDIDATLRMFSITTRLTPEFRPAPERWFDADIVIDDSPTMRVWSETASALPAMFQQLGAFRSVRTWRMSIVGGISRLLSDGGLSVTPGQLRSPDARRLIVVVTDGASAMWLQADTWDLLRSWAASTPTALISPLATRLWDRTGLALPAILVGPGVPGTANPGLRYKVPYSLTVSEGRDQHWLPVPAAPLSPHMLGRWARTLMKGDPQGCHALLIPSAFRSPNPAIGDLIEEGPPDADGAHIADAFRKTSSAAAARLAVLCAPFADVDVPLLRLLAQSLVSEATSADLAEVIVGGLFHSPAPASGDVTLQFRPGVRERLQELLTESDAWRVYDVLAERGAIRDGSSASHEVLVFLDAVPEARQRQSPPATDSRIAMTEDRADTPRPTAATPSNSGYTSSLEDSGSLLQPAGERQRYARIWGSETPFRNPHFTGRETELAALREQLESGKTAVIRQPPSALYGLGGVGKTQIATEYAHRYSGEYDVVWWVRADREDSIRASLVALGRQMRLPDVSPADRDMSVRVVIDALQSGDPTSRWLLIFDDVTQPHSLRQYIPQGGHVIVTSRVTDWRQVLNADGIEVREFSRADTVKFLRNRVPQLTFSTDEATEAVATVDAERLAEVLGDLPLAAEHAAAYLSQTGESVPEYIAAFERDAHSLLGQDVDMFASRPAVATTWSVTLTALSAEAQELFKLLAFFAPEPISEDVLFRPGSWGLDPALPSPLQSVLASRTGLKRAQRELARFSLISIYGQRNVAQMHRVVQAVTRGRVEKETPDVADVLKRTVFALLAATDPDSPEQERSDSEYERTIRHLVPTGALESDNRLLRNLIINQVRRLRMRDRNIEALSLGESVLQIWQADPDDIQTLALAIEVAGARRTLGQVEEAFTLNADTLDRLRRHHGEDDDTYLIGASSYGEDLRLLGRYDEALEHDSSLLPAFDRVFAPGQFWPLSLRGNIAADLRCTGRYAEALDYDTHVAAERERLYGPANWQMAQSQCGMTRDLEGLGRYEEALEVSRKVADLMETRNEPRNFLHLEASSRIAASLRRLGYYAEAHDLAEDIYRRYVNYAGQNHRATLVMAINLICDRRVVDELAGANELGAATVAAWETISGPGHPNTLNAKVNLAVVLRARGYPVAALELNQAALDGFRRLYAYDHPSTLIVLTNLASDLAAVGDVYQARQLGEEVVAKSGRLRGPVHPATLAASANLARDLRATGDRDAAAELEAQTLVSLDDVLTPEHPISARARQKGRIDLDIIPATL